LDAGRHTADEVLQLINEDFDALVGLLGEKKYFLGDKLNLVDIIVYSELYGFVKVECLPTSPIRGLVESRPTLHQFFERVHSQIELHPPAEWVDVK
jgi:glutathione S-transferase